MNRLTIKELHIAIDINKALDKLSQLEDLLEKYEIEDLVELEIALEQYYHRYDNVETRRVNDNE